MSDEKVAFVTLVMRDSSYAAGAAVLAHSIRSRCAECKCQKKGALTFDLVCMHTNDVEEATVRALSSVFDHVVPISYIQAPFVKRAHRLVFKQCLSSIILSFIIALLHVRCIRCVWF